MKTLNTKRVTSELEWDFVVFPIGMWVNTLWKINKWFPVFRAMSKLLEEMDVNPDSGLLTFDSKFDIRNHDLVQYWRSVETLREYALGPNARHAPSMK